MFNFMESRGLGEFGDGFCCLFFVNNCYWRESWLNGVKMQLTKQNYLALLCVTNKACNS